MTVQIDGRAFVAATREELFDETLGDKHKMDVHYLVFLTLFLEL